MQIDYELQSPQLDRLRARYRELLALTGREIRAGLPRALEVVRRFVVGFAPVRSGRLASGIETRVEGNRGHVFTRVPYGPIIEGGSRPHDIRPRRVRALRYFVGGQPRFAARVHHPGTRAYRMFARGFAAARAQVTRLLAARLGNITKALRRG